MDVKGLLDDFLSLWFPNNCMSCKRPLFKHEDHVCTLCQYHLPYTRFAHPLNNPVGKLFYGKTQLELATAMCHYHQKGRLQTLMHELKYRNVTGVGVTLGRWLGQELKRQYPDVHFDGLIPVPLHPKKLRVRGYNQCDYIAQGISETLFVPVYVDHLQRIRSNATQTRKSRFERWKNTHQLFTVNNSAELEGKHLLLIDDVVTTGATLEAASLALTGCTGVRVSIAALACA